MSAPWNPQCESPSASKSLPWVGETGEGCRGAFVSRSWSETQYPTRLSLSLSLFTSPCSLSVSLSLLLSHSVHPSLYIYPSLSIHFILYTSLSLFPSPCVPYASLCLSVSYSLSVYLSLCISLFVSFYHFSFHPSLPVNPPLAMSICFLDVHH